MATVCSDIMEVPTRLLLSAGTLLELRIVAARKSCEPGLNELLRSLPFEILDVTTGRDERQLPPIDNGTKASTLLRSTSAIASPTQQPRSLTARSSSLAMISRAPTSAPPSAREMSPYNIQNPLNSVGLLLI